MYGSDENRIVVEHTKYLGDDFDPEVAFQQKLREGARSIYDVDDSHFVWADNVVQFFESRKYCGYELYPRQLMILSKLFDDVCLKCSDMTFFDNIAVDEHRSDIARHVKFLEHGVCPNCRKNRMELLDHYAPEHWELHNEMILLVGMRAGKSSLAGMIATYLLHRFFKLPDPAVAYGLLPRSRLMGRFTARTKDQAGQVWEAFTRVVKNSYWFGQYHKMLVQESKARGMRLVSSLKMQSSITYEHKPITMEVFAANHMSIRGGTGLFGANDETGWMNKSTDGAAPKMANGREVVNSLEKSLSTVRSAVAKARLNSGTYDLPNAYLVCISSPSSSTDDINYFLDRGLSKPTSVAHHYTSLELAPNLDEAVLRAEAADEATYLRDYEAVSPIADSPFMDVPGYELDVLFCNRHIKLFDLEIKSRVKQIHKYEVKQVWCELVNMVSHFAPISVGVDSGRSKNSYCIVLGFYNKMADTYEIISILEVKPVHGYKVNFEGISSGVFVPLVENLDVKGFRFDRWNSAHDIDMLNGRGVDAKDYTLKLKDFEVIKGLLGGRVLFPTSRISLDEMSGREAILTAEKLGPIERLHVQLATVRQYGKRIIKPERGDDDLFRALCQCVLHMFQNRQLYSNYTAPNRTRREGPRVPLGTAYTRHSAAQQERDRPAIAAPGIVAIPARAHRSLAVAKPALPQRQLPTSSATQGSVSGLLARGQARYNSNKRSI